MLLQTNLMGNPFDTPEMRKLNKEWSQKLKESGFEDAEDRNHPESPLKTWHSFKWKGSPPAQIEATQAYFAKALEILSIYTFENETHRRIWELHCQGFSKRKIETQISKLIPNYKREQIGNIINFIVVSQM